MSLADRRAPTSTGSPSRTGWCRSPARCSPTPRPRSACTASWPPGARARSCSSRPSPARSFSRWSFVGVDAVAALSVVDGEAAWTRRRCPPACPTAGDPLAVLGAAWRAVKGPRLPGLPPLTGGFVGYLGYDVVRRIERLPDKAVDELGLPELTMLLVTDLAAVDHHECTVVLIANAVLAPGHDRRRARRRLRRRRAPAGRACRPPSPPRPRRRSPRSRRRRRSRPSRARRRGSTSPPSSWRSRRSAPARCSRSRSGSASSPRPTPTRSTSTGCCARSTRRRTCTSCAPAGRSTSSAAAPRRWSP